MPKSIVDTHVHVWDLGTVSYAWLKDDNSILNRTYRIEEIKEERIKAGITNGILVQAANNFEDTGLMLGVAQNTGWITGIIGWLPLMNPDATQKKIEETYLKSKYLKGCRHLIHNEPDPAWLLQDEVIESLTILAKHQLTYDIVGINNSHLHTVIKLCEKVPGLKMVLNHLNQPPVQSKEKFGKWGELMKEASFNKDLYAKISGLGTAALNGDSWTKEDIKPYVLYALEVFGKHRCFCGGDWPVSLLAGKYQRTWGAYQQILAEEFCEKEQEDILYHNAVKFYNL